MISVLIFKCLKVSEMKESIVNSILNFGPQICTDKLGELVYKNLVSHGFNTDLVAVSRSKI